MTKIYKWIESMELKGITGAIKFILIAAMIILLIIIVIGICLTPMIMCVVCWVKYAEIHQIGWLIGGIITTIICFGGSTTIGINNKN